MMTIIQIVAVVACLALLFGSIVLFVLWIIEQIKDEKPTYTSYLSDSGIKFWKQIKK